MVYINPTIDSEGLPKEEFASIATTETTPPPVPLAPEIAEYRARKAELGLPVAGKTYEDIFKNMIEGREDMFRLEAAAAVDLKKSQIKQRLLSAVASTTPGEVVPFNTFKAIAETPLEATDSKSVIEEFYGKKVMDTLKSYGDDPNQRFSDLTKSLDPRTVEGSLYKGGDIIGKVEYARTKLQDAQTILENQSYVGYGVDVAKGLVPFYSTAKVAGFVPGVSRFLPYGSNIQAQAEALYKMPMPEYKKTLDKIFKSLSDDNPELAVHYLQAIVGQSHSDELLGNLIHTGLDLTFVPGLAKLGQSVVKGITRKAAEKIEVDRIVKDVTKKVVESEEPPRVAIPAAVGDAEKAGINKAADDLVKNMKGEGTPTAQAVEALPSAFRDARTALEQKPGNFLGREGVNSIAEAYTTMSDKVMTVLGNMQRVSRTPIIELSEDANKLIRAEAVKDLPVDLRNSVLDVAIERERLTNTFFARVELGQAGSTAFHDLESVGLYAQLHNLPKGSYTILPEGIGHKIVMYQPIREGSTVMQDVLLKIPQTQSKKSRLDAFTSAISKLRSPEELISKAHSINRDIAVYTPAVMREIFKDEIKTIQKMSRAWPFSENKKNFEGWKRIVETAQDTRTFFDNVEDLGHAYQSMLGRLPNEAETRAYFAFARMAEADHVFKNVQVFRDKTIVGAQSHRFYVKTEFGAMSTPSFDAIRHNKVPGGYGTLVFTGKKSGEAKYYTVGNVGDAKTVKSINDRVTKGELEVVEITSPASFPLKDIYGDHLIRYVVTDKFETKPLSFNQVPRSEMSRMFSYEAEHAIKQANIHTETVGKAVTHHYLGDTLVMPASLNKMGADIAKKLNVVRELIRDGRLAEARAVAKDTLPIKFDEMHGWFTSGKLSLSEPFYVTKRNGFIHDLDHSLAERLKQTGTFKDSTREGPLARRHTEADADVLWMLHNSTANKPLYNLIEAKTVDPIRALNRSISKITNSTFLDDYKLFAATHWIQEATGNGVAGRNLLVDSIDEIRRAPLWYFNRINEKSFKSGVTDADKNHINRLLAGQFQVQQLMGMQSFTDTALFRMASGLAESIYGKYAIDMSSMLPKLRDPFRLVRSVVFHPVLGMFNPAQFMVQAQTLATSTAIAGFKFGAPASKAASLHLMTLFNRNPEILAHLDKLASKQLIPGTARFKPGEFLESLAAADTTGFLHVGNESSFLNILSPNLFVSKGAQFLDAGTVFFKGGELMSRMGAWHAAYLEYRAANPTGKLGDKAIQEIFNRADLFSVNMSRASQAGWQKGGFLSVTSQFVNFQLRMAELMTGSRLSFEQKMRVLTVNSIMYGLPVGAVGTFGLPFSDSIRKFAIDNGSIQ
jgi:hypothetical protein